MFPSSYQSISLVPVAIKIYERIVKNYLLEPVDNSLPENQFGFTCSYFATLSCEIHSKGHRHKND